MVLSPLHYIPSAIAAVLMLALPFSRPRFHRELALAAVFAGALGFLGYITGGNLDIYPIDFHSIHSWCGMAAFLLSSFVLLDSTVIHKVPPRRHCLLGYAAAVFAAASLIMGLMILTGQTAYETESYGPADNYSALQESASGNLPEREADEYLGVALTPIRLQGNNAISGTQNIDLQTYRLNVTGLVERNLSLSYDELLSLPAYSEVAYMPCVEGWGFYAKWTGFRVTDLLNLSGLKDSASYVVFHTEEGYSTGLPLDYLRSDRVLMAYGINDLTLPPERGFPLQLVAKGRFGYKWAKWITEVEVTGEESRGYWESRGYSNSARTGEFPFG